MNNLIIIIIGFLTISFQIYSLRELYCDDLGKLRPDRHILPYYQGHTIFSVLMWVVSFIDLVYIYGWGLGIFIFILLISLFNILIGMIFGSLYKIIKLNGLLAMAIFSIFFWIFLIVSFINVLSHDKQINIPFANKEVNQSESIKEKCVIENKIKICDLAYSIVNENNKERTIKIEGNEVACVNTLTGSQKQVRSNLIKIDKNNVFCASDFGNIYIDSSLDVSKYFNKILRDDYGEPYYLPSNYDICLWTYSDGSGDIPNIYISNQIGPSSGWDIRAFCKNISNGVSIYSYEEN